MENNFIPSLRFHQGYGLFTFMLLVIEILIALYVHDNFIRPYGGDYLVVILLYCFVRSFINLDRSITAIAVLLFAYLIELMQYFSFVERVGLSHSEFARTVIGTSFHWYDMWAYTFGIATVIWVDLKMIKRNSKTQII